MPPRIVLKASPHTHRAPHNTYLLNKTRTPHDTAILLLGVLPKEIPTQCHLLWYQLAAI